MPKIQDLIPGVASSHTPSALTNATAAVPAGGTGVAAGGWSTAANRDIAIAQINNLRTRVTEMETALKALGILA